MSFSNLSSLDLVVFIIILFITVGAIVFNHLLSPTSKIFQISEFLLMGRRLTLPLFVFTLVASWYGGIFGVTQIAYESGIYNFITQGCFWYIAYLLFAFFLIKPLKKYPALTLPDLLSQMFGPKSRRVGAVFNFFNVLPIAYAISLGLFLKVLFGGDLFFWTSIGVAFAVVYSFFGGFRAVVISDAVQFFVMCFSVLILAIISVWQYGGYEFLKANLPDTHFQILGQHSLGTTFVWGFIALSTLVDPNFYQRCFAAESTRTAKWGILLSILVWVCFDLCTTLGGMYARAVLPEIDSGTAYLTYALEVLPSGLRGFVLAGILATILSTIDSYLLIAGTSLTVDLTNKTWWKKSWLQHAGIVFVGFLAVVLSYFFEGSIRDVWKTFGSYSAACLLVPVLVGYWKPGLITDRLFVTSSLLGAVMVTYWKLWKPFPDIDALYAGILVTSVCIIIGGSFKKKCNDN